MVFDAPSSSACDCRSRASDRAPNFSIRSPASPLTIERPASVRRFMFGPSSAWCRRLLRRLLSSAAPSRRLAAPVAHPLPGAGRQTSQGKTRDLRSIHLSHVRRHPPDDFGLQVFMPPRPGAVASMRFLFVRPELCVQLPSDPASRQRPCCSASGSCHQGPQRTFTSKSAGPPPQRIRQRQLRRYAPCLAHMKKPPRGGSDIHRVPPPTICGRSHQPFRRFRGTPSP